MQQPSFEDQRELHSIEDNESDSVIIRNHKYSIRWIRGFTRHKISQVYLKTGNDYEQSCMAAALMILNGYWKIKFFYWIVWRWFYYILQYGEEELTDLLALGKKKVPLDDYFANTILLAGLTDTNKMMTKKEIATILREQNTDQHLKSQKNTAG